MEEDVYIRVERCAYSAADEVDDDEGERIRKINTKITWEDAARISFRNICI